VHVSPEVASNLWYFTASDFNVNKWRCSPGLSNILNFNLASLISRRRKLKYLSLNTSAKVQLTPAFNVGTFYYGVHTHRGASVLTCLTVHRFDVVVSCVWLITGNVPNWVTTLIGWSKDDPKGEVQMWLDCILHLVFSDCYILGSSLESKRMMNLWREC